MMQGGSNPGITHQGTVVPFSGTGGGNVAMPNMMQNPGPFRSSTRLPGQGLLSEYMKHRMGGGGGMLG